MAKDTFYFQHDYEPTSDPKITALIGEFGAEGYGIYWRVVEMLHSDENHKLSKKNYIYSAIAKQMSTSVEQVKAIVDYCCSECELFFSDESFIWSERVLRNIEKRDNIRTARSEAGKKSAEKRALLATSVEQKATSVQQNSTKERKGKERKGKVDVVDTPPPTILVGVKTFDEYKEECISDREYINAVLKDNEEYKHVNEKTVINYLTIFNGDLKTNSVPQKARHDYRSHFRYWLKKRLSGEKEEFTKKPMPSNRKPL